MEDTDMRDARVTIYGRLISARPHTVAVRHAKRFAVLLLSVAVGLGGLTQPAFSLGVQNTEVNLPANIRNAIVRIGGILLDDYGTGIVIRRKRDPQGNGGWLCVLTASHVLADISDENRDWFIGFLNGDVPKDGEGNYRASICIRHRDAQGKRADLMILGVYIRDFATIPEIPDSIPIAAPIPDEDLVACGYGWRGQRQTAPNRYVVHEEFGTFRNGKNRWKDARGMPFRTTERGNDNEFESIGITFDLGFPSADKGEAHVLPGDSGGPSLQFSDGKWKLIGIHSTSTPLVDANENGVEDSGDHALEGHESIDVRLINYIDWINASCNAVPEPFSLTALSAGLLGLLLKRRRAA